PRVGAFTGFIDVIDIGLDLDPAQATAELLDADDLVTDFPRPGRDRHKYSRGISGILAGSEEYPGAGVLTTTSAVNPGAGMGRYPGPRLVAAFVIGRLAGVVTASGRVDAVFIGPGDPEPEYIQVAMAALTEPTTPLDLAAGGLDMVGRAETMTETW